MHSDDQSISGFNTQLLPCSLFHFLTHSFTHSPILPFTHSHIQFHSSTSSPTYSLIHSPTHSPIHSLLCSRSGLLLLTALSLLSHAFTQSSVSSLTHPWPFMHSITFSLIFLTHSLTDSLNICHACSLSSLIQSLKHAFIHLSIHPSILPSIHPSIHSFIHSHVFIQSPKPLSNQPVIPWHTRPDSQLLHTWRENVEAATNCVHHY